jgi:Antirepressor regulating drug resistance, predicted signal transduction N-terminal membrane component
MSSDITYRFALVLLHSLWIAGVTLGIAKGLMMVVNHQRSRLRYTLVSASFMTFVVAVAITLIWHFPESTGNQGGIAAHDVNVFYISTDDTATPPLFEGIVAQYSAFIFGLWLIGATFFALRFAGGLWYLRRLTSNSFESSSHIQAVFRGIASKFTLAVPVRLAESTLVTAPMVTGILKPLIILPAGFATGISTQQLEAILAHELVHVTRHDFLVNIIQSLAEALFFFNPFVWMLSDMIRREREHVCDDAVVELGFDKILYVRTLAQLEATRLAMHAPALSFADNKKILLHRIKRLMEKSIKTRSTGEKLLPAVLLIMGLACAAWLNVDHIAEPINPNSLVQSDTIRPVQPVQPKQPDTSFEFDEPLSLDFMPPDITDVDIPDFPDVPFPDISEIHDFPEMPNIAIELDTIPFGLVFPNDFDWPTIQPDQLKIEDVMSRVHALQDELSEMFTHMEIRREEMSQASLARAREAMENQQKVMENVQEMISKQQKVNQEHMQKLQAEIQQMQQRTSSLQKELHEQLVKDGYLSANEKIETLHIENGNITVNGKAIRDSDRETYQKILDKHSSGPGFKSLRNQE